MNYATTRSLHYRLPMSTHNGIQNLPLSMGNIAYEHITSLSPINMEQQMANLTICLFVFR